LNRTQAMSLLKELVAHNLVDDSYISILQVKSNQYRLKIKCNYDTSRLKEFAKNNKLFIEADKERKYLDIYKP